MKNIQQTGHPNPMTIEDKRTKWRKRNELLFRFRLCHFAEINNDESYKNDADEQKQDRNRREPASVQPLFVFFFCDSKYEDWEGRGW